MAKWRDRFTRHERDFEKAFAVLTIGLFVYAVLDALHLLGEPDYQPQKMVLFTAGMALMGIAPLLQHRAIRLALLAPSLALILGSLFVGGFDPSTINPDAVNPSTLMLGGVLVCCVVGLFYALTHYTPARLPAIAGATATMNLVLAVLLGAVLRPHVVVTLTQGVFMIAWLAFFVLELRKTGGQQAESEP